MKITSETWKGPRSRLVTTALRLFFEQGYNLTGINQILKESGVAKASLYEHFPSKDDLLIECLTITSDHWFKELDARLSKGKTPQQKVLAAFDVLLDFQKTVNFRGCDFQNILAELPADSDRVREVIRDHKNKQLNFFRRLLSNGQAKNDTIDAIATLYEGAFITTKLWRGTEPVTNARQLTEKILYDKSI